jgi:5,10-methenyltetrahydromethanopterin hydrogenase
VDEVPTRNHAEAHVKAVLEGDMESVENDFAPEIRDGAKTIAKKLPSPTTDAEIKKLDMEEDHATVEIHYSSQDESITIRTRWEERDGRPMIVEVSEALE